MRHPAPWLLAVLLAAATPARASCGGAFCSLHTDWAAQGQWTEPGAHLDLRYEYIDQDRPRAGRNKVAVGEIPRDHDEERTLNRNLVATLDYTLNPAWGFSVQAPFIDRTHSHIHHDEGERATSQVSGLGDVRVLGRWRAGADDRDATAWGLLAGLKLPTGDFKKTDAAGTPVERTLQPGTGTTDAILGVYRHAQTRLGAKSAAVFIQARIQAALDTRDDFRPGDQLGLDAGLSYPLTHDLSAMLQANALLRKHDGGAQADPEDSGGTWLWLSPGLAYALGAHTQLYGFVQLPVYQRVNGVQLTSDRTAAVGMSVRF